LLSYLSLLLALAAAAPAVVALLPRYAELARTIGTMPAAETQRVASELAATGGPVHWLILAALLLANFALLRIWASIERI
jgi:hypothetical protein